MWGRLGCLEEGTRNVGEAGAEEGTRAGEARPGGGDTSGGRLADTVSEGVGLEEFAQYLGVQWDAREQTDFNRALSAQPSRCIGTLTICGRIDPEARAMLALEPCAKFIILQRDKSQVVSSFLEKVKGDLWRAREPSSCENRAESAIADGKDASTFDCPSAYEIMYNDVAFPKYPYEVAATRRAGAEKYWDEYRNIARRLERSHPEHVRIFASPDVFYDYELQMELLRFTGLESPKVLLSDRKNIPNCIMHCFPSKNETFRIKGHLL
ncbi:hypothetical protein CYMTET_9162 [Cymbomonas tetramitiformis]|uniref:Sulfotransferase n=1 Tax=Cymbomonas tetramitiformis TaxID=36881 RepID=A0AAE0LFR9_9CHLO|nr:hypothetical protein CYMTET_9162 [Cymbomonas tetramitiformis]